MKIRVKYQQPMKKLTTEEFIKRAREIHDDKYDYSKVKYVNNRTKICIICPIHGEFWQTPSQHLQGHGCIECGKTKQLNNIRENAIEVFLDSAKKIHEGKYTYPNIFENYVKNNKKIPILQKNVKIFFIKDLWNTYTGKMDVLYAQVINIKHKKSL